MNFYRSLFIAVFLFDVLEYSWRIFFSFNLDIGFTSIFILKVIEYPPSFISFLSCSPNGESSLIIPSIICGTPSGVAATCSLGFP